jgi:signal transduction histidine kinase
VNVAQMKRNSLSPAHRQERRHEVRAALFGIEASVEALSRHREHMTDAQLDELTQAMIDEVRRLRGLLAGRTGADALSTFDLGEAIGPVVACARASGLDVSSDVPLDTHVEGSRDSTAQVVLALLDNARRHAGASPVEVRVAVRANTASLYVEDRGSGVSPLLCEQVFERGWRGGSSTGSGLGLFIARRLMAEQGGSIAVRPRAGGGASFVLQFRRDSSDGAVAREDVPLRSVAPR